MRTYFRWIMYWATILAIMVPMHLYAACQIMGTTMDGYIIVCDGPDTIGVNSGNGNDIITINIGADVTRMDQQSSDSTATATATTINARRRDDQITNKGKVSANASMTINVNDVILTLLGSNEANASVTGDAIATGIDSGSSRQKDSVTNNGTIDVAASSKVIGGEIQLDLFDVTKADATLKANATATGIKGTGSNEIANTSTITVTSTASVTAWTGEENTLDQATANTTITPTATAVGISGGSGYDKITNTGIISATANAEAYANVLELNAVDAAVMGAGVGSVEEPMKSAATGISVGNGGSEIVNSATGKITANASSVANIASVILTLYDFTLAPDISKSAGSVATNVSATSTGISGGRGRDIIINDGEISANATSIAMSEGLGVGAEGVPSGIFPAYKLDIPLADATITATSEATGIQSGASGDRIVNTGKITADADTVTFAMNASVSFPLLELIGAAKWWNDYPPAIAIAGAGTEGKASAWGIRGGEGNDTISNSENPEAIINVNATSIATTNEASVTLQNLKTAGGGFPYYANLDLSLANAATKAESTATGIDGEGGNDFIENKGTLTVEANSIALGNACSVAVEGLKGMKGLGVAIVRTKVGTEGTATAMGIIGGEGNDEIRNTSQLDVDAHSLANSLSANVSVQGEMKGVGVGVAFADATTTSTATATGISGGDGSDTITNGLGRLHAYATSEAYAESFSVVVQAKSKGVEIGGALALGTTTATASVTGMDGGTGDDTFLNQGLTDVKAEATANTLAASVDVQASVKGVGVGFALIDTATSTVTDAVGISGSNDTNSITNNTSGTIKVRADSNTYAESFAVTVQGESTGLELGGALALSSTTATATAMGISGGKGGDGIYNYGMVDVRADATTNNLAVAVDVQGSVNGLGLGVAFSDVSSTATTTVTGISSGEGDDTIHNSTTGTVKAYAESDSYSEVFSVNVQGKGTGIMIGGAIALAGSTATATATGMDGGAGKDDLINEGFTDVDATSTGNSLSVAVTVQGKVDGFGGQAALTDTSTSSTANAFGISGGDGQDTITNSIDGTVKSHAKAEAYAESVSVSVQGYGTGVTMAGSLARGVTTPTASATGISGGEGDDILINHGLTGVKATTDSTSVAVAVRTVGLIEGISIGASLTDTSTTANATAIGMDGGLGNDVIYNSGTILANTDSTLRAASVSFDFGGVPIGISVGAALASASTNARGTAIGISGGEGDDNITNAAGSLIDVDSTAIATSTAVSISANVIGAAWTNTSATTLTQAIGISGGEGKDGIANMGTIDVDSNSTAKVANVSVNLIGATPVSGWTSSTANAMGIDAGLGDDWIQNEGIVTTDATSTTDATGVAVQVAGYSNMDISTNAIANATGINAGNGVNTIYNTSTGSIRATATTDADTTAVNINLLGYSKTDGSSTGAATAIGIAGGNEADRIRNDGTINSTAFSDINASSTGVQLVGYGETNAKAKSTVTVKGIDGDDGINTLINIGSITGTATANANATSYDIQLAGGAKAAAGTEATATAIGIAGGKDMDTIRNEGTINLTAQSTLVSTSRSYKIFGFGFADADSKALAIATGIDGGDGANTIANVSTGLITVSSNASATATGMTANIGVAGSSASTTSKVHSTGIKSGGGEDTIINEGILNVNATSSTYAGSGDLSLIGLSFGDALTEAITEGIVAGDGKDVIFNKGTITVASVLDNNHPMAYSNVDSVSFSFFNISSATFGSKAQATGIIGGGGDDTIINQGTITVGDDDWMAKGRAYGFSGNFLDFLSLTSVGATAETVATGIEGSDGNDNILNDSSGMLTVKATSYVRTEGAADTTTFGSPAAFASSTTKATVTGISGGEGDDVIENKGKIDVYAYTWADAYSDSWVGWGSPRADSTGNATATAVGINAGEGQNFITNSGLINVSALAEARPYANANSNVDTTDSETTSYSKSTTFGILAGDGGNIVNNTPTGKITVTAMARTYDPQGNIAKAESDEEATATAGSVNSPITANAVGISLGKGDDTVTNDGRITVRSESDAWVSAYSDSWPYNARSDATAYAAATAKGIAAGVGVNGVINDGQINVSAWSHANPITDSWSRDQRATANATADSNAVAVGMEADGNITNALNGSINVNARATAYADANTNAETTTATANLMATATGIGTASSSGGAVPDRIQNDGIITVKALAGEDENGNPKTIALADTDVNVRSDRAEATGTSTVDAAGIRAGDNDAVIINNGNLTALGRARGYLSADAFSRDYNPTANARSNAVATAVGIQAAEGSNAIINNSLIDVDALAEAQAQGWADSWSSTTHTNIYAGSVANGKGIAVGDGENIISNEEIGIITVNSTAKVDTFASSDENANAFIGVDNSTAVASNATAIQAGQGNNVIANRGQITVASVVDANSQAYASSVTFTATAIAKTGASADATGIKVGDGNNTIRNDGVLFVAATNEGKALSDYPSAHLDWAKAYAGAVDTSLTSIATGISAGNGVNIIESHNTILVTSKVSADAQAYANTSTSTNHGEAYAGGVVKATGIAVGNGQNMIKSYGNMTVSATAGANALGHAEDYGYAYIGSESAPGVWAEAIGVSAGNGINEINNYGTLEVNATATAYSKGRAHTTSVDAHGRAIANSYATATGMHTEDGMNIVNNYGTISVSALGSATAVTDVYSTYNDEFRYAYQSTDTTAVGIQTGAGDDIIANYGTISATNTKNGVSSLGIAISSGAGNDTVFLTNGSETKGHIDLGDGDDWLTFTGTPIVSGNVTGANGIDTLVFNGAGSIGFTPTGFENAIKQGAGTFTVANLPTMQRIEIRQSALQVNNNYQFSNSGFFQTFVNGDGNFGQFKVNGTTQLAGDLSVLKGPGPFLNGTTYNIIEAIAVNNAFSNVMLPAPNNFVSFGMDQFPNLVQIEAYVKDFTWLARNRVEWAVANYLDRILPSATGELLGILGQFQNFSQSEYSNGLSSLSPDSYDNFTRNTFSTTHRYTKSLQYRMNNVRSYLHVGQSGGEEPILLAYRGSDAGELYNFGRVTQIQGKYGLWLDAFGQWGDQEEKDGYTGFDYFMRGATLGFDHALSDKFMTGISVGYSRSDVDLDDDQGSGYIKSLYGSLYGSYFYKNLYIDGILSYGRNWYDNHRLITIGTDQRRAYSKHDGDLFSAYLQEGYYFDIQKWLIGPFVSLQYIYLDEESFKEKGAGGVSLNIDGRQTNSLVSELGVRLARVFKTKYGSLIPEVSAAWLHDFDIDDRVITSSFAGFPGASFSIKGQDVDRNGATLGAGITFIHKSGLSTSLRYMGEFREKYKSNGIMGELRFTF
jgi:uncharacterized protein YhjY with autotransporter beta-barrel domain